MIMTTKFSAKHYTSAKMKKLWISVISFVEIRLEKATASDT